MIELTLRRVGNSLGVILPKEALGRDWSATTDSIGVANIHNLPSDPDLFVDARSATHRLRKADRERTPTAHIEGGRTTRRQLLLEAISR